MKPIIRIGLINRGYGHKYFLKSLNPVVRAHATAANFRTRRINVHGLAKGALRDCIEMCEVNEEAAEVYADVVRDEHLDIDEKMQMREVISDEAVRVDTAQYRSATTKLLRLLSLLPALGLVRNRVKTH